MAIISLVMVAALTTIYVITYANVHKENRSRLQSVPMLTAITPGPDGPSAQPAPSAPRVFVGRIPVDYSLSFAILVDADGKVTDVQSYLDLPPTVYAHVAETAWQSGKPEGTMFFENRKWQYRISTLEMRRIGEDGQSQVIHGERLHQIAFLDTTASSRTLTQLLITFIVVGTGMLGFIFGGSLYYANRSIRPIEAAWQKQKLFVADASHELKTPLAIISANADALLANGEETVNSQKRWIGYIQSETRRMGKLVNDMLYLARAEDTAEDQVPFDLSHVVADVIASMQTVMFERGITLTQDIEPALVIRGDSERIKQAVLVLLDNAAKYVNQGGRVGISLKKSRGQAVFAVHNTGAGIPPEKLPKVFDRFYRSDPSRSQETGGYGLGLSIAKAIIERSGGSIHAESSGSNTTFTFLLKLL